MLDRSKTTLDEKHRAELHASGITDATIEAAGIFSTENAGIRKLLGWQDKNGDWGRGWVIPYDDGYCRVKLDYPRFARDDKPIKYESPVNKGNHAYFPPGFDFTRREVVIITEGEKKTLCISQLGYVVIGLPGVWAWQIPRKRDEHGRGYGRRELLPELAAFEWHDRDVVICFDSDAGENQQVRMAEYKLAELLIVAGAGVRVARIPADGDAKVGADDFIVANGAKAFAELIGAAEQAERPPKLSPMDWARLFVQEFFEGDTGLELRWHRDEFWRYVGTHYARLPDSELQAIVLAWLDKLRPDTKPRHAADVVRGLASLCRVPYDLDVPVNLAFTGERHPDWLAFRNGIINLPDVIGSAGADLLPHSAQYFSTFALSYDYDPHALCKTWFTTLNEIFGGDAECVNALGEFFGYCLTDDTSQQKILLLEGPPRSGKGTILRQLQHVIGPDNYVCPRLTTLPEMFGLWGLVGKRVAICPDAALGHGDKALATLEILKSVSGEDAVEVHRKHLPPTNVRLRTRFALAVNELPKFGDDANALSARLLILPLRKSFVGQEDRALESKLAAETPGVLNWALDGLRRMRNNNGFTRPEASKVILDDFERLVSPIKAFLDDNCELAPNNEVFRSALWERWREWCKATGHRDGCRERFGSMLRLHVRGLGSGQRNLPDGSKARLYVGLKLKASNC